MCICTAAVVRLSSLVSGRSSQAMQRAICNCRGFEGLKHVISSTSHSTRLCRSSCSIHSRSSLSTQPIHHHSHCHPAPSRHKPRITAQCRSSNSSNQPSSEHLDLYLTIVSSSSWQQLHNIFYDHRNAPSYQHCYGILLQLAELLPEMQQHRHARSANSEVYSDGASSSANGANGSGEGMWSALATSRKVQTAAEVNALKSLLRDVLRALQVQLHLLSPQELLDTLEASLQITVPSNLWLQAWEMALQPHLKHLQLQQLMLAAGALLGVGYRPSKPWAGIWFVSLQPHIFNCTAGQLAVTSLALESWGCKPPLSWTEPYMEAVQSTLSDCNMSVSELLTVLCATVSLGLKPCQEWLRTFESASQRLLFDSTPLQLATILQGLQLLGHKVSVGWLVAYLHAAHARLGQWDIAGLGSVMVVLGQQPACIEALEQHDSSSSSEQLNNSIHDSSDCSISSTGFLSAVVAHTEPLIQHTLDPGVLVNLLCGYHALKFTPSDAYLDLLLDTAAAHIVANSGDLQQKLQSGSTNSSTGPGTSGHSSSRSRRGGPAGAAAEEDFFEEPLLLQADQYQPDRNISLGGARKLLESSWAIDSMVDSLDQPINTSLRNASIRISSTTDSARSSSHAAPPSSSGPNAAAAAAAAAGVSGSMQASALVVGQVLQLLSVVADMNLPVDKSWVAEVLGALKSHCIMIDIPELQLLLELCQRFGVVLEPEQVDELLVKSHVDYSKLNPEDQLQLLALLAASETRPNNIWWQGFLSTLQQSLKAYTPAQLVLVLTSQSQIGGRPPQAWLAAHESALLTNNNHSNSHQALSPEGWLVVLECYARFMYQPSEDFESVFERYMAGILGPRTELSPGGLASLVGSVARLQLACSPQLEEGIISSLDQVLPRANSTELQSLIQGLLLLELQLPSTILHQLCSTAQPHLAAFNPAAICCLLQLIAAAGEGPPSPTWLDEALGSLESQIHDLEALGALMLLQSLKAFRAQPSDGFMAVLQRQLVLLLTKFDAMGVATVVQGLASCGSMPTSELQLAVAGHIKKGLVRPSQGMGPTPLWLILEVLVQMQVPAASPVLLDELLVQTSQQFNLKGTVSGSRLVQQLLPQLAVALTAGGAWGLGYSPPAGFCSAFCSATLERPQLLSSTLWLDLLLRFSLGDVVGFKPTRDWIQIATQQIVSSWGSGNAEMNAKPWASAPAYQLAALLHCLGCLLQRQTDSIWLVELPGFPHEALKRLKGLLWELDGRQMAGGLLGVSQLLGSAERAAAAAGSSVGRLSSSSSNGSSGVRSITDTSREQLYCQVAADISAAAPELLTAAEVASLPKLSSMAGNDLAVLIHAMQQLNHVPNPNWFHAWSTAVCRQLPGMSGQSCVMCLVAVAAYQAQPDPAMLRQLLQHCQHHIGNLQLAELLAFGRSLELLGFRLDDDLMRTLGHAGLARIELMGRGLRDAAASEDAGLGDANGQQLRKTATVELQKVLLALQLQQQS